MPNDEDLIDYETAEKLMNFLPFKYTNKIQEKEFYKDLLTYSGEKFNLLSELANILSREDLFKFLYIFSGKELKIPEKNVISNSLRDLDIFYSCSNSPNKDELIRLSKKYAITVQNIANIVKKVSDSLGKQNPINP